MLSQTEKMLLKELLALAPYPEQSPTFNELLGYMYGLAITPVDIPAEEWTSAMFDDAGSQVSARDQARGMEQILNQVHATFMGHKLRGTLHFPYQIETIAEEDVEEILEWVAGFEVALGLRPELWEPDEEAPIPPRKMEELFFSMMVIQGLTDPVEVMEFFDKLPPELFMDTFQAFDPQDLNRDLQVQAFLLATLPLTIQTLQNHGDYLERTGLAPTLMATAPERPEDSPGSPPARLSGKGKIIHVDFLRKKRK